MTACVAQTAKVGRGILPVYIVYLFIRQLFVRKLCELLQDFQHL